MHPHLPAHFARFSTCPPLPPTTAVRHCRPLFQSLAKEHICAQASRLLSSAPRMHACAVAHVCGCEDQGSRGVEGVVVEAAVGAEVAHGRAQPRPMRATATEVAPSSRQLPQREAAARGEAGSASTHSAGLRDANRMVQEHYFKMPQSRRNGWRPIRKKLGWLSDALLSLGRPLGARPGLGLPYVMQRMSSAPAGAIAWYASIPGRIKPMKQNRDTMDSSRAFEPRRKAGWSTATASRLERQSAQKPASATKVNRANRDAPERLEAVAIIGIDRTGDDEDGGGGQCGAAALTFSDAVSAVATEANTRGEVATTAREIVEPAPRKSAGA
eukprot:6115478-Pleurochrysis_carterae.AAC.2